MLKLLKRILLPIWLLLFLVLLPYDFIMLLMFDEDPLGVDLLDWVHE